MSGYYPNNASVAEIYKSVITDVINQVKEAFLDENVDTDVLQQLRKDWEDKVNSSGCVELEPRNMMQQNVMHAPPMRAGPSGISAPRSMQVPITRMPSGSQPVQAIIQGHPGQHPVGMQLEQGPRQVPVQMQYMQHQLAPGQHVQAVNLNGIQTVNVQGQNVQFPQGVRVVSMQAQQAAFMQNQQPMMIMQNSNGPIQQIPFTLPPNVSMSQIRVQQQMHQHQPHQLDGCSEYDADGEEEVEKVDDIPESSKKKTTKRGKGRRSNDAEAHEMLAKILEMLQLDGGGGGMSDSSSEEEEEENDPLRRIADKIGGDGTIEEGETIVEEDPLNSEDDDQDDEDLDTIFEADHVIMCLFEKVHRARNKWKFNLKDGVMNINNRDYCFQKCTGDAEW